MNNNFVKFAFAGLACAAFCTTTFAAPKGGHHGGTGRPARAPQQTRALQGGNGRPARAPQQTRAPQGGNGHTARTPQQMRAPQGGNGHTARTPQQMRAPQGGNGHTARVPQQTRTPQGAKPNTVKHAAPTRHVNQPAVGRQEHFRLEPRHHAPPHRVARHHLPSHAHYWARPAVPLWRDGALRAWEWVEQEWVIVVNGVYYYGDGYYYDGYNYYYNGEYHTVPPPPMYY